MNRYSTSWFKCAISQMNSWMFSAGDSGRVLLVMMVLCYYYAHAQLTPISVIGKPTYLSTTHPSFAASNAVDGNLGTIAHNSAGDPHPVLRVDMETEHCLGRITVTLRDTGCGSLPCFLGTVIRAGLSPNYADNQPCGLPGTEEQSVAGGVSKFLCETPRVARYVTLDIDPNGPGVTDATLKIAEVKVEVYPPNNCTVTQTRHFTRLYKDAKITNSSPVSSKESNSLMKCAARCSSLPGCTAFEYAASQGQCRLHNISVAIQTSTSSAFSVYAVQQ